MIHEPSSEAPKKEKRNFTAPPSLSRCVADVVLRDGSGAQCMRRADPDSGFCCQHAFIEIRQLRAALSKLVNETECYCRDDGVAAKGVCAWHEAGAALTHATHNDNQSFASSAKGR